MDVDLFVSVKDLPNSLFLRNLELILSVTQSIYNSDELTFLCKFSNEKLLVLPPRNGQRIANKLKVKVSCLRDIELFLSLRIDKSSRVKTTEALSSSFDKSNFSRLKNSSKLGSSSLVISIES